MALSRSISSSEARSDLLKQISTGRDCRSIITRNRSSRLRLGAGSVTAKTTSAWSALATAGRIRLLVLGRMDVMFPVPSSSLIISISTLSPTRGFIFLFLKIPLALHS